MKKVLDFLEAECKSMNICILSCFGDLMTRDTGTSVRIYYLSKSLAELGHEVHVVIPGDRVTCEGMDGVLVHSINGICPNRVLKFFSHILRTLRYTSFLFYDFLFIIRASRTILKSNITQIEQPWAGGLIIPLVTRVFRRPIVVDSHDTFQALRIKHTSTLRKILETFFEKLAYKYANSILTVSKEDEEFLVKYGIQRDKIKIAPNGVDTQAFKPFLDSTNVLNRYDLKDFHKVIFVGNMEYLPNQEAVHVIASDLAPKIQSEINNVKFLIVGRTPSKLASPSLIFAGVVENVAEFLAASDVAIAPLLLGSGSRLKILEYLSCGLPVVSTTVGAKGLEVENEKNVLIEDNMDRFAFQIKRLLKDRWLSMKLGSAGRELVTSKYDWRKIARQLNGVYYTLLKVKR